MIFSELYTLLSKQRKKRVRLNFRDLNRKEGIKNRQDFRRAAGLDRIPRTSLFSGYVFKRSNLNRTADSCPERPSARARDAAAGPIR